MEKSQKISILGAGSWGSALAVSLARNHHHIHLWCREASRVKAIASTRYNEKFLPGIYFPENIQINENLAAVLTGADYIILAVPSHAVSELTLQLLPLLTKSVPIIIAAKGIDPQTGLLMPEILIQHLGTDEHLAVLAGPTFAKEIAKGMPSALAISSKNNELALKIAKLFQQSTLKPYINHDIIGTALGGAVKNVIAIAVGISDGHGYGANAKSALITRGLAEMIRLGKKYGVQSSTLFGLSGVGDLVLTCTDDQSRNRRFGFLLGQGVQASIALAKIGQVVEGATNAEQVYKIAQKMQVEMPITELVYQVLHHHLSTEKAVELLLSRDVREEGV